MDSPTEAQGPVDNHTTPRTFIATTSHHLTGTCPYRATSLTVAMIVSLVRYHTIIAAMVIGRVFAGRPIGCVVSQTRIQSISDEVYCSASDG